MIKDNIWEELFDELVLEAAGDKPTPNKTIGDSLNAIGRIEQGKPETPDSGGTPGTGVAGPPKFEKPEDITKETDKVMTRVSDVDDDPGSDLSDDDDDNSLDNANEESDENLMDENTKRLKKLRYNIVTLYYIINDNLKSLSIRGPLMGAKDSKIFYNVQDNLQEAKQILFTLATDTIKTEPYSMTLRKYVAITKVYDICIEILNTYFEADSDNNK